jgi:hypothetical protein
MGTRQRPAMTYRPDTAVGLDAALTTLAAGQPYGTALLLLAAAGLACSASTAFSTPVTAAG